MTRVAHLRARVIGAEIDSVLLDIDLPALKEARKELPPGAVKDYVCASADRLPFAEAFDMAVFANSLHLLDDQDEVCHLERDVRDLGEEVLWVSVEHHPADSADQEWATVALP